MPPLDTFDVPLFIPSLCARAPDALLYTSSGARGGAPRTVLLDLRSWPPRLVEHELPELTLDAARSPSGRWLLHVSPEVQNPRTWRLRTYASSTDTRPATDDPPPIPPPNLKEVLKHLDAASRSIEAAQTNAIEDIHYLGERAVLVPRHVGLGRRKWPLIEGPGGFVEARKLPPFTNSPEEPRARPAVRTVTLGDGADVLLWNGGAFEQTHRGFARTFQHDIDIPWYLDWTPMPAGRDGFFYLEEGHLHEIHRGAARPRVHLPDLSIHEMHPGPGNTLLLRLSGEGVALYDPEDDALIEIPPDLLPPAADLRLVAWSEGGFLVAGGGHSPLRLRAIPREEIDDLPRRRASTAGQKDTSRSPAAALLNGWSASRPRVAVDRGSEMVATVAGAELRVHCVDTPRWRWEAPAEIVAVAGAAGRFAALTADGRLHELDARDGGKQGPRRSLAIAPHPRSLAGSPAGAWAVLDASGVHLLDERAARELPFPSPLAAAFDAEGRRLLVTCEDRRAALIEIEGGALDLLPEPPEEAHAVAWARGDAWLALGQRSLLRFDAAERQWSAVRELQPGDHIACSPRGRPAIAQGRATVDVCQPDGIVSVLAASYPERYQNTDDALAIVGLQYLDEGRLVVGLTRGNANIFNVDEASAMRIDPFRGAIKDRWVFVCGGDILIAD